MKRNAIFMCDILACIIVFAGSMIGPWDRILGFNFYHSRGDVWLPTPLPAENFFRGKVSTGSVRDSLSAHILSDFLPATSPGDPC